VRGGLVQTPNGIEVRGPLTCLEPLSPGLGATGLIGGDSFFLKKIIRGRG
jgi:hypothetical protein